MESNAIKMARELGKAIQGDELYKAYYKAKDANDGDEKLQDDIGEFNLIRQKLVSESSKPESDKDNELIIKLNEEAQIAHSKIMDNENMKAFNDAKIEMDKLINDVSIIISLCCDGEDPDTCEIPQGGGCGGNCGGCSGCG